MVARWHLARAISSNSNSNVLYLNTIGFKAQSLWGREQIKLMKSKLIKCRFLRRGENRSTPVERPLRAEKRTNKINPLGHHCKFIPGWIAETHLAIQYFLLTAPHKGFCSDNLHLILEEIKSTWLKSLFTIVFFKSNQIKSNVGFW